VTRDDEDCAYENVQKHRDQKRGIALYLLGDLLGDVEFRVHVLDLFITKMKTWEPSTGLIEMVWEAVPKDSPLRTVVLQLTMAEDNQDFLYQCSLGDELPLEFGADALALAMGRMNIVDDSFPATVLRTMIEGTEDENASPQLASDKDTASK
jgi:hypothetical protein